MFILLLSCSGMLSAQLISYKESNQHIKLKTDFKLVSTAKDRFYSLDYDTREYWMPGVDNKWKHIKVTEYDNNLNIVNTREITGLEKKVFLNAYAAKGNLRIFAADKEKNVSIFTVNPVSAQLEQDPMLLYKAEKDSERFFFGFSADSNYCYVFSSSFRKKEGSFFNGAVIDRNDKIINHFSFKIDKEEKPNSVQPIVTTSGKLYIATEIVYYEKGGKGGGVKHHLTEVSNDGSVFSTELNNLPEGQAYNFSLKEVSDGIQLTGTLFKNAPENAKHLMTATYSERQKKLVDLKEVSITEDPYWQSVDNPRVKGFKKSGLPYGSKFDSYFLENGDLVRILQTTVTQNTYGQLRPGKDQNIQTTTTSTSITAICLSPDLKIKWLHVIPLSNYEWNYKTWTGYLSFWQKTKGLYIFFNDHTANHNLAIDKKLTTGYIGPPRKGEKSTYLLHINEAGSATRVTLDKELDDRHQFAPGYSSFINGNQILISSGSYGGIRQFGWRPALITIN